MRKAIVVVAAVLSLIPVVATAQNDPPVLGGISGTLSYTAGQDAYGLHSLCLKKVVFGLDSLRLLTIPFQSGAEHRRNPCSDRFEALGIFLVKASCFLSNDNLPN